MKFALALLIAAHFWADRGVTIPCHPVAIEGRDAVMPLNAFGRPTPTAADVQGCAIYISANGAFLRHAGPGWYCMDVVHEIGHLAGLSHTPRGLMAPALGVEDMPYDCQHWRSFRRKL